MVTELGVIYSAGKHWTGSMIELGYSHHELGFPDNSRSFMDPLESSSSSRCSSRRCNSRRDGQRGSVASSLFIEHYLEAASSAMTDGSANGTSGLPPSLARLLLQLLKERDGFRHSLTSLLPSDRQEAFGYEFRHRKARCRSCEPQAKSTQFGSAAFSTAIFERFVLNVRDQIAQNSVSLPRKRLSLSDSEICYAKDLPEVSKKDALECDKTVEAIAEVSEETTTVESSETADSPEEVETPKTPIFEAGPGEEDEKDENEVKENSEEEPLSEPPFSTKPEATQSLETEDQTQEDLPVIKITKKKKSVRFADDLGKTLFEERIIINSSLPPTLHFQIDDDFRDLGDDDLPGVIRPSLRTLGQKTSSLPDIKKIPPPIPRLCHSNSSNESLNLGAPRSPPSIVSPTNGSANWRITFAQPAAQYLAFRQRLDTKFVSLENITLNNRTDNANSLFIYGKAKVKNIAFEKHVKLRVTTDKWATYKDFPAVYNTQPTGSSSSAQYDQFMFNFSVDISKMPEPKQVQFAVCFQAGENGSGGEYWDNNDGCNYVIIEEAGSPQAGPYDSFRNHPSMGSQSSSSPSRTSVGGSQQGPPGTAYTLDYRPNFNSFSSLTSYSSWQHYSSESMYY